MKLDVPQAVAEGPAAPLVSKNILLIDGALFRWKLRAWFWSVGASRRQERARTFEYASHGIAGHWHIGSNVWRRYIQLRLRREDNYRAWRSLAEEVTYLWLHCMASGTALTVSRNKCWTNYWSSGELARRISNIRAAYNQAWEGFQWPLRSYDHILAEPWKSNISFDTAAIMVACT